MQYDNNSLTCSVTTNSQCIKVHEIICILNLYVLILKNTIKRYNYRSSTLQLDIHNIFGFSTYRTWNVKSVVILVYV